MADERHDVVADALLDVHGTCGLDRAEEVVAIRDGHELIERRARRLLREHPRLLAVGRVAEREPRREAVELRLGERIRPLVLDRVLRGDDEERLLELVRLTVDRHLRLLHRLEQCGLRLR